MRSVDLNFASAPFRNNTPYVLAYGLGALILTAFTAYNGWAVFAYSQSRALLETDHAAKKSRLETLYQDAARMQGLIKQKNLDLINAKSFFTNGLLDRRRFSWTDLLNSLEEVQPYQVRLLSLLPRITDKGIIIESRAVAKDLKAFWNFQQNLQNHPKFRRVYPGGWLRMDQGEYVFNLSFNYFPAGAPVDVQGVAPDEIVQAPGERADLSHEEELSDDLPAVDEDEVPAAPPPRSVTGTRQGGGSSTPARSPATVVKGSRPSPQTPSAQANPPAAAGGALDGGAAVRGAGAAPGTYTGPGARSGALVNAPVPSAAVPPPPAVGPDGDPIVTRRWTGRGLPPGSAGKPPAPGQKAGAAVTVPVIGPPPPPPPDDGEDEGDPDEDEDDTGDER